jgi:hypothetical protein
MGTLWKPIVVPPVDLSNVDRPLIHQFIALGRSAIPNSWKYLSIAVSQHILEHIWYSGASLRPSQLSPGHPGFLNCAVLLGRMLFGSEYTDHCGIFDEKVEYRTEGHLEVFRYINFDARKQKSPCQRGSAKIGLVVANISNIDDGSLQQHSRVRNR